MRGFHVQAWLGVSELHNAMPFAVIYGLQGLSRSLPLAVLPLTALDHFGSAQGVSLFYFATSFVALMATLLIPVLVHRLNRRRVMMLGSAVVGVSAILLANDNAWVFSSGMCLFLIGFIALEITLNLYLMDKIPRREFGRFEPVRILFLGVGYMIGPVAGVILLNALGPEATYGTMFALTLLTYVIFLYLRLSESEAFTAPTHAPPNPFRFLLRFFHQPRLTLAWLLALGRSGWWAMYFIYIPIFCVEAGISETMAGIIVSAGVSAVLLCPLWGRLGQRFGIRRLLICGYALSAVSSLAIGMTLGMPWVAVAMMLIASFVTSSIDGAGNMLFLRAVHPYERSEMTSVFITYRDISQITAPGIFTVLLSVFALPAVFVSAGVGMAVMAWYSRYIPRQY